MTPCRRTTTAAAESRRPRGDDPGVPVSAVPAIVVIATLLIGALAGALWTSLHPGAIVGGDIGLDAWRALLGDDRLREALAGSVVLAVASTTVSSLIAVLLAPAVRRSRVTRLTAGVPVAAPHLVIGVLVVTILGPGGLAGRILGGLPLRVVGDEHGLGMLLAYVLKEVPFLILVVLASWASATDDQLEAARSLGASRWRCTRDVLVPRMAPGLAAGAAVVSAFVVGAAEIPVLVGSNRNPTLATYALDVTGIAGPSARPQATAALLLAAAVAVVLAAGPLWWAARRRLR